MGETSPPDLWTLAAGTRYPIEAFIFVQRGLDFTVRKLHGESGPQTDPDQDDRDRHVTGQQLCHGLKDFALEQYGLLARLVLRQLGIYSCEDFGRIVFTLVDSGLMRKTDDDRLSDFVGVFDFAQAFRPQLDLDAASDAAKRI